MTTSCPLSFFDKNGFLPLMGLITMSATMTGCAPGRFLAPITDDGRVLSRESAITRTWEDLTLTVRPAPRSQVPSEIRRSFTVMEVTIENRGHTEAMLRLEQFALVDPNQVQYSPMPPEDVDRSLDRQLYPGSRVSFSFGYGRSYDHWGGYRRRRYPDPYPYPYSWGFHRWDMMHSDSLLERGSPVFRPALRSGPVAPGARKQGWLYFNRLDEEPGRTVELLFLADGKIRLIFPMRVMENR